MFEIDPDRVGRSPFTVGAIGALVTALKFTPGAGLLERVVNVLAGSIAAGFVTPAFIDWLHPATAVTYANGAAFMIGLLGMSLAAAIMDWFRSGHLGRAIDSWLNRGGDHHE